MNYKPAFVDFETPKTSKHPFKEDLLDLFFC